MLSPVIEKMTALIVNRVHPDRIFLFGSRARGDFDPRSDFDIAVEGGNILEKDWDRLLGVMENQSFTLLPVDLIRLEKAGPGLAGRIKTEGMMVYDKRKAQNLPR